MPLSVQKFFSGLWTQRSPFNSPDNRYSTRFLGGRPDMLIDGLNCELTNYGTIIRRPGMIQYSTATLTSPGLAFYSFHDLTGTIRLMVDTTTKVSTLTPTTNTNIFTKTAGSVQTDFIGVGNTLFFGDGIDLQAFQPNINTTSTRKWGIAVGSINNATGPNAAGTGADVAVNPANPWTNPGNITANDNVYAIAAVGSNPSDLLQGTNFGFSIPLTSTIVGIQVDIKGFENHSGLVSVFPDCSVQLLKNGNLIGNIEFSNAPQVINNFFSFGGPSDLWGTTWSPGDINSATFGIAFQAFGLAAHQYSWNIDFVRITIYSLGGPIVSLVAGSLSPTVGYQYVFAYGNSNSGHISNPTPPSFPVIKPVAQGVQVSLVASTDPQVNQIRVFRTKDGGSVFYELPTSPYPNTTANITDNAADTALQQLIFWPVIPTVSNTPPPVGLVHYVYHLGRIWGVSGNFVFWSGGPDTLLGSGNEAWPPANNFLFPSTIVRLVPYSSGLLVFTTDDTYIILGTNTVTFYPMPFQLGLGLLGYNAMDIQGSNIFLWTSDRQFIQMSSAGINEIGYAIGDQLQAQFDPNTNIHVASLIHGTSDKAVFIGDSVGNWYRCNWNQPPEGGPAWSPKASIVGGFTTIQVIETAPGIHQLLASQTVGTGAIVLARSQTAFSDNGIAYNAFITFGSIVLAQPGQLAEVVSVTTELQNVGSQPNVSVLLEEISGIFESLPVSVPDPPGLTPSNSVLATRFYLNQAQQTVECRHMQVKITFAPEVFKNELLTLSIFGALKYRE